MQKAGRNETVSLSQRKKKITEKLPADRRHIKSTNCGQTARVGRQSGALALQQTVPSRQMTPDMDKGVEGCCRAMRRYVRNLVSWWPSGSAEKLNRTLARFRDPEIRI